MKEISRKLKQELAELIFAQDNYLGRYSEEDEFISFFGKIWPLNQMPSTDNRFKTADRDIYQHMVNNEDWSFEYLINDYLNLIDGENKYFNSFLELVVSPEVRLDKDEIIYFVSLINGILQVGNIQLGVDSYFEGLPVYKLRTANSATALPVDIAKNKIRFYKEKPKSYKRPPYFYFKGNSWDDYGSKTSFETYYVVQDNQSYLIGPLKLLKQGESKTLNVIPNSFTQLDSSFCSLGQDESYYERLKELLGEQYQSVLLALRDTAIFPKIHEDFERDHIYQSSLMRNNQAEQIQRTIRYSLVGLDPADAFSFKFKYTPPYAQQAIAVNFDFSNDNNFSSRIKVIIGKNGAGKTQILSAIANSLSKRHHEMFSPRLPLYGKVFSVSYGLFEQFPIPKGDALFNYSYCGVRNQDGSLLSEEKLKERFFKSAEEIGKRELVEEWYETLCNFIHEEELSECFSFGYPETRFRLKSLSALISRLSSGQSILMYVLTEVLAQIRLNSLILFDEPETHLHPNAISELMKTLSHLLNKFSSFCIIATHSPIIVQEVNAENVFVFERNGNCLEERAPDLETYGANLTSITEEIFGRRDIEKQYVKNIENMIEKGFDQKKIVSQLESEGLSLPLNTRLLIKSLLRSKKNEES
ncbi:MAG: AAA family ATPase [Marinifilaceae bacterium]